MVPTDRKVSGEKFALSALVLKLIPTLPQSSRESAFASGADGLMEAIAGRPQHVIPAIGVILHSGFAAEIEASAITRVIREAAAKSGLRFAYEPEHPPSAPNAQAVLAGLLNRFILASHGVGGPEFDAALYGKGADLHRYEHNPRYAAHVAVGHLHAAARALAEGNRRKAEDEFAYFLVAILEIAIGIHRLDLGAGLARIFPRSEPPDAPAIPSPDAPPDVPAPGHADTARSRVLDVIARLEAARIAARVAKGGGDDEPAT